jgi:hypothetical protein
MSTQPHHTHCTNQILHMAVFLIECQKLNVLKIADQMMRGEGVVHFRKRYFLSRSLTFSRDSIQQQKRFCECQFCVLESLSWMTYALTDERDASDLRMRDRSFVDSSKTDYLQRGNAAFTRL